MTTHVVLRHFDKRRHPLTLPPRLMRTLPAPLARTLVALWRVVDRRAVGLSPAGVRAGRACAQLLAQTLRDRGLAPVRIITSPYRRTRESAALLASVLRLPVVEDERLVEWDLGARSACDFEAFCRAFPAYREAVERDGYLHIAAPYAHESFAAVREVRVRTLLAELSDEERSVIVVTHYSILDCIAQLAHRWPDDVLVGRMAALHGAGYGEGLFVTLLGDAVAASGAIVFPHSTRELQ